MIDEAAWLAAARDLGVDLDPSYRRANVMLRGIDFRNSRGRLLRIGASTIRVSTETTPCSKMEKAWPGLRAALKSEWRGGVTAEIIESGTIRVGDHAEWIS